MSQLLSSQSSSDSSTDSAAADQLSIGGQSFADQLISQLGGSDGQVSLSQIDSTLGLSGDSSSSLSQAFGALDSNGDGELSTSELASAMQSAGPPHFMPDAGGKDMSGVADSLSNDLINSLGGSDGSITLSQWTDALSSSTQSDALSATDATSSSSQASDPATQLFNSLDSNGDGTLTAVEIASALQSFMATQLSGQAAWTQAQSGASVVA